MKSFALDALLGAISAAVAKANRTMQDAHVGGQLRFFGAQGEPVSTELVLPRQHLEEGEAPEAPVAVPHATLTHGNQVLLENLTLELDCLVEGIDDEGAVSLVLGPHLPRKGHLARLTVSYRSHDTPEGAALVNDQLLKTF